MKYYPRSKFLEKQACLVYPAVPPVNGYYVTEFQLRVALRLVLFGYPVADAFKMCGMDNRLFAQTLHHKIYEDEFPMLVGLRWSKYPRKKPWVRDAPLPSREVTEMLGEELV